MKYAELEWREGQPYSPEYDDIYYSESGGRDESEYVFLKQNNLLQRWARDDCFVIAEAGFGTGLNFILTLKAWVEHARENAVLHYIGIEKHPVSPDDIRRMSQVWPDISEYFEELLSVYPLPVEGTHTRTMLDGRVYLHFQFMDVIDALKSQQFSVDAWYLDGFGPEKNPDLWSVQVFKLLAQNSKKSTTLSTYTCAGSVRRGLTEAGFDVIKLSGHGKKREMITAVMRQESTYQSKLPWYDLPSPVIQNKSIAVIGAGLAGLSVAWSFVQRGWKVTIIDKHDKVAQEASGNLAGLVLPRLSVDNKYDSMFYSNAFLYAVNQLEKLQQTTTEKFWFKDGVLSITKQGKVSALIEKYGYHESLIKLLSEDEIPEYLSCNSTDVSFYPSAGWALPGKICDAILALTNEKMTRLVAEIGEVRRIKDEWQLLSRSGEEITVASVVVVANGVSINDIDATSWMPVSAVRGQMTTVTSSNKNVDFKHAISFDAYVTPNHNGVHYLGASYSIDKNTLDLLEEDQDENFTRLEKVVPGMFIRPPKLNGRVGFRAVSADRMPIVGAVPDMQAFKHLYRDLHHGKPAASYKSGQYLQDFYISVAHGSRGMCSCFLSAEVIASMVENTPLPLGKEIIDVLNPARFLIRDLKRNRFEGR